MAKHRLLILNAILLVTLLGSHWGRRIEGATLRHADILSRLNLPFRNWSTTDVNLTSDEQRLLEPDAVLVRRYWRDPGAKGLEAELAVIAGHRKKSIHTPGFCMAGGGWETLWTHECRVGLPEHPIEATRSLMSREDQQLLVTYFFTDGDYTTRNLVQFQMMQVWKRFRSQVPIGALVRLTIPVGRDQAAEASAERLCGEFAQETVPAVMQSLRLARVQVH